MRARILLGALVVAGVGILAGILILSRHQAQQAEGADLTIDVGSDWFCDASYESADPNVYCTTTVNAGDTVTFHRVGGKHNAVECGANFAKWNGSDETCGSPLWKSPDLNSANPDWAHTFDTPGSYYYLCEFHYPDQKGKIIVQAAATPTPTDGEQISLAAGWNLISLPLVPADPSPAVVLASVAGKLNSAWAYQAASSQAGGAAAATWLSYDPAVPPFLNTLTAIDVTMGVWVNMKQAATLSFSGTQPGTTQIAISQGWNFIGYPSGQTQPVADVLAGLTYNSAWAYDPTLSPSPWQSYDPNVPPFLNTLQDFTPGRGYALNAPGPGTVTVTNSAAATAAGAPPGRRGLMIE